MTILRRRLKEPQAPEPLFYFDVVQTWFDEPLQPGRLRQLRRQCANLYDRDGSLEPMPYNQDLIYCVQARQPTTAYLETLLKLEATMPIWINYAELARDECWPSRGVLVNVKEYRDGHELRLWHPKAEQTVSYDDEFGNTYDASRKKPRLLTRYMEEHSRITGELDCLHTEFRLMGKQSCERAGIETVSDLINFNHEAWWAAKTRIVTSPDYERLGRLVRNRRDNTRDRKPLIEFYRRGRVRLRFNHDWRLGYSWVKGCENMQAFVDSFGGVSRLLQAGVFSRVSLQGGVGG
jgi:hypothetical protein